MLSSLPIVRYQFTFVVTEPIQFPQYAGSTLRGAFGRALRKIACMTKQAECKDAHFIALALTLIFLKHQHQRNTNFKNLVKSQMDI